MKCLPYLFLSPVSVDLSLSHKVTAFHQIYGEDHVGATFPGDLHQGVAVCGMGSDLNHSLSGNLHRDAIAVNRNSGSPQLVPSAEKHGALLRVFWDTLSIAKTLRKIRNPRKVADGVRKTKLAVLSVARQRGGTRVP